jgi:Ca-activated chloride channel family protein
MHKFVLRRAGVVVAIGIIAALLSACGASAGSSPPAVTLRLLSASENQTLQPIIERFAAQHDARVQFSYEGSVDIRLALEQGAPNADAVWPSNSLWITLGDTHRVVKDASSVLRSPIVMAVKKSVARRLGWIGRRVRVQDILNAAVAGKLRYMMTSASQSNSGASAYIGYLYAFAGDPPILTSADLQKPGLRDKIKRFLGTVNRSSASSGFLKQLFLSQYDYYDGMVNYESVVIETNQELVREGKEPLYAIYPVDGLAVADSPLGYVDHGNAAKAKFFHQLQNYLLSAGVQKQLLQLGRRTGPLGLNVANAPKSVFNPAWGIDLNRVITPVRFPKASVIDEALTLYQTAFRKPSITVFAVDFSGSMADNGGEIGVKNAMKLLLDPQLARRYLLQVAPDDITVVIPFNDAPIAQWAVHGNNAAALLGLDTKINALQANGGTDIYTPVIRGLKLVAQQHGTDRLASIILMTDGMSNTGATWPDLKRAIDSSRLRIPIYAILFGDASTDQLSQITKYTHAAIFDGRQDLVTAFRTAKGYNS